MSEMVALEYLSGSPKRYHRADWFLGRAYEVSKDAARMVAATPCRTCYPEAYDDE